MNNRKQIIVILSIFVFSVVFHLKGITGPLLDFHSWRQTQTAMMSRNYYENGFRFFHPQIDWTGIDSYKRAGTEFPIFSYLVALLYKIFGEYDFLGRFLAVFFSACGAVYLFFLIKKFLNFWSAYISSLIFCVIPVKIYFTRTVQPESLMLFSTIAGIYYFSSYLENTENKKNLIISCLFLAIAPLVKLPSLYAVIPVFWLARQKFGKKVFRRIDIWLFYIFIFLSVYLWYNYAKTGIGVLPLTLSEFFKNFVILGKSNFWARQFLSRFIELTTTYSGLVFFAVGFWFIVIKLRLYFFAAWFLSVVIYTILIGEYGYVHQYTALPYSPINAIFIGGGIVYSWERFNGIKIKKIFLIFLILAISTHSFVRIRKWYKLDDMWLLRAREVVGTISSSGDLFLCNSRALPIQLYHIHRKGFAKDFRNTTMEEIKNIVSKKTNFVLTAKDERWQDNSEIGKYFMKNYPVIYEEKEFKIFGLKKK